ncbi:MAG: PLP-dependent cysteine synthase family protein [Myxococcota bacterium]|jgi:cysteine synthase B|nr:PLP-dependent cysteine synthase family protein [Myxococcota bacterium]
MRPTLESIIAAFPALKLVGNTPLAELHLLKDEVPGVDIFAKIESFNPGGSIKDRPISRMLIEALISGELAEGKTILDSSSGNAGIAYAMFGAMLGFKVKLVMPANVSTERKKRIMAHGAEVVLSDALLGYDEALRMCHEIYAADQEAYFFPDQYSNPWNWQAHYETTAMEILEQRAGTLTHFVAGVGTGGTITGVGRRLKEEIPDLKVVGVRPDRFPGIEGLKPLDQPEDIKPAIFDPTLVDEWIEVGAEDAFDGCAQLAQHGYFFGQSSGAYFQAVETLARREKNAKIVTIFCDIGERYLSTGLYGYS